VKNLLKEKYNERNFEQMTVRIKFGPKEGENRGLKERTHSKGLNLYR
jgi:hypothetical protein